MGSNGNHRLDLLSHAYIHPQSPTPMDSNGLQWYAGLSSACIILNLQLQMTPMGSNGNHRLNQLSHAYLHILQLQWTPMGSNGKLGYALSMIKLIFLIKNNLIHKCVMELRREPSQHTNRFNWSPLELNI